MLKKKKNMLPAIPVPRRWEILFTFCVILLTFALRCIPAACGSEEDNFYAQEASQQLEDYYIRQGLPMRTEDDEEELHDAEDQGTAPGAEVPVDPAAERQHKYTENEVQKLENKMLTVSVITDAFKPLYDILVAFGYVFMSANLVLVILRDVTRSPESVDENTWMHFYIVMAVSFIVMGNMDLLLDAISKIGDAIVTTSKDSIIALISDVQVGTFSGEYAAQVSSAQELLEFDNTMTVINLMTMTLNCLCDGLIYALGIRMVIRRMFMPLAIADMAVEGARSAGFQYMLRYLGYYLQMAIIYICMIGYIFIYAIAINTGDALTGLWLSVAAKGALAAVLSNSGQMAYEVLNVG